MANSFSNIEHNSLFRQFLGKSDCLMEQSQGHFKQYNDIKLSPLQAIRPPQKTTDRAIRKTIAIAFSGSIKTSSGNFRSLGNCCT
jgi:hypothetical protein